MYISPGESYGNGNTAACTGRLSRGDRVLKMFSEIQDLISSMSVMLGKVYRAV
jgi:hypothetical protein